MSSSGTDHIRAEIRGKTLVLTIDRPHAGNSLSLDVIEALETALAACPTAELVGVIVTGEGGKFFCTGGDVKAYRTIVDTAGLEAVFGAARCLLHIIEDFPLPVLAAIDGYALGGGLELALSCDLRFAAPGTLLGFPQVRLGIIPGWNGTERLVRAIGRARAMRLLLTGRWLTADEALSMGLIDEIAPSPLDAALAFLDGLDGAPLSIGGIKAAIRATDGDPAVAERTTNGILQRLWFTADHREAEAAFAEKRKPNFQGH